MEYSRNILFGVKNGVENGVGLEMKHYLLHFFTPFMGKNGDGLEMVLDSNFRILTYVQK